MWHRSLARSAGTASSLSACATCVCSCGRRFGPATSLSPQQKRFRRAPEASAEVWLKERDSKRRRPVSQQQKQEKERRDEEDQDWHLGSIERAVRLQLISVDTNTATDFLNAFAQLCDQARHPRSGTIPVNRDELESLIAELKISEKDATYLARSLLRSPKDEHHVYGKKLLFSLSHIGRELATMLVMKQMFIESKRNTAKLNAQDIQPMRKHLKEIAERGENFRAMVLQGRIDSLLGNQNAAIQMWTGAMASAVAHAEQSKDMGLDPEQPGPDAWSSDFIELGAPWVELAVAHIARKEWAKARGAITIGCEMDDPTSHYHAASFKRRTDPQTGMLIASSGWLYHMTKAAASGHPKAAYELGYFYGHSLWPYIEDEPPDDIKPTPFDRYPPDGANIGDGLFDKVRRTLGLGSPSAESEPESSQSNIKPGWKAIMRRLVGLDSRSEEAPTENIFKTAMFPTDPKSRMLMALEWLKISHGRTYAPAHLLAAQLRLEKTLWAEASTPRAALDMTDDRYTYASKADYEAGIEIERPAKDDSAAEEVIPNPYYDPQMAYAHIIEVFNAHFAQRAEREIRESHRKARRSGMKVSSAELEDDLVEEKVERTKVSWGTITPAVSLFFRFPEVREMYSDDERGVLFDDLDSERRDIVAAAKEICEEQKWDVYDEKGGLMYKHGLSNPAPAAGGR